MRSASRATLVATTASLLLASSASALASSAVAAEASPGSTPAPADAPRYDVIGSVTGDGDLGPVGRGMNELGTIVGWVDWPLQAFEWDNGTGTTILPGLAGDQHRVAVDINDAGVAVGHSGYETIEPPQHAVRWIDGVPDDLGTISGGDSHAEAINEAGMIVGWGYVGSDTHAFVWTEKDGMVDITPTARTAYAYDVNESGQV